MKSFIFIACLGAPLLGFTAFANEPAVETAEDVEDIKRSEFSRQQYALFNKTDKNFDGQITHDEILRLTHEVNKPKYVAAFRALDTNNNGVLSYDEIETKHGEITSQQITRHSRVKENLLKQYDLNGNGVITSRELDDYIERKSKERRDQTGKNAARDLKGKDADDSGSVSLNEYLDSKTIAAIRFTGRTQSERPSLTRDPNGDKIITRSENESYVSQLFEALDKNKDDKLSATEQADQIFEPAGRLTARRVYLSNNASLIVGSE